MYDYAVAVATVDQLTIPRASVVKYFAEPVLPYLQRRKLYISAGGIQPGWKRKEQGGCGEWVLAGRPDGFGGACT
jgi:hypothetical protein